LCLLIDKRASLILHITTRIEWETAVATAIYRADSLETDGFIRCSTLEQVIGVANAQFQGRSDFILLCIDPARLDAPLIYEDCYESGQKFPHVYGPLNLNAVVSVMDFPPGAGGNFALPDEVEALRADETVWLCETERDILLAQVHIPEIVEHD
jgi:uncharacterized protein (DUF952 family)